MERERQYLSELNTFAQKQQFNPPEYEDASGPPNKFTQRVRLNGEVFPEGLGNTKKEARYNAAKKALEILTKRVQTATRPDSLSHAASQSGDERSEGTSLRKEKDFISKITAYCLRENYSHSYIEVNREGPSHDPRFTYKLEINKKDYPMGTGKSKTDAKQMAAQLAWSALQQQQEQNSKVTVGKTLSDDASSAIPSTTQEGTSLTMETDIISEIHKYCQRENCSLSYIEVNREGPPHDPLFTYKLEINKKDYPVGTGKSKKDAKQKAAELAWSALQQQQEQNSKSEISEVSDERRQNSSGSDSVQFIDSSKSSNAQVSSDAQGAVQEKNGEKSLATAATQSRFQLEYDGIECLGRGTFGYVYKARNKDLKKYFAIKEIQCKDKEKSLQEVKVLSDLLHPNIVRYYTFWFEDTAYKCSRNKLLYIKMELCDGGTLRHWISERNKDSSRDSRQQKSLQLTKDILSGVAYIHLNKLIHRDLKPANIFFGQNGIVRIGDFGLATQDSDDDMTEGRGTPSYMAPEQMGTNYDRKVDIFALGLIFFELLWRITTGHERVAIWKDVKNQNLPKEFTVAHPVESCIIKTMLSENPEHRPEASAIKAEIEKWSQTPDHENQTI